MKYNVSGSKFSISSLPIISTNLSIRRPISLLSTSELIFGGIVRLLERLLISSPLGISMPSEDKVSSKITSFIEKKIFIISLYFFINI